MRDLQLDSSHDIQVSSLDFVLIDGAESVKQQLLIKLKLWVGEWFLDEEFGTPYIQSILGKQLTLSGAITAIQKSILEVTWVQQIQSFAYQFSNSTRRLSVQFTVSTAFGLVEVQA
jgi:hypothetical protein